MVDREVFPKSIDVNPTSKCNLSCSMCWGPDHSTPDLLTTDDWMKTIKFFSEHGTDAIVFTGGEPLLRKDIPELLKYSKQLGMRVTLSTNTILLLPSQQRVFPYIDELGVPMDASTSEKNLQMREGKTNSFTFQINTMQQAKTLNQKLDVTVRTVASKMNLDDLLNIGILLSQYSGFFDRWKIYQFSPFSYGELNATTHTISYTDFLTACNELRAKFPYNKIETQSAMFGEGRYVFVGSQGDVYGVGNKNNYLLIGNVLSDTPDRLASGLTGVFEPSKNLVHAHDSI